MTGTLHVGETLYKWVLRQQVDLCPLCNEHPDTVNHRVWLCRAPQLEAFPPRLAWLAQTLSLDESAWPLQVTRLWWEPPREVARRLQLIRETEDDFELVFAHTGSTTAAFMLSPSKGPVFTDGSAFDTGKSFPTAAFAIVQLSEQRVGATYRSVTGLVPPSMQSSAAAAERVAIAIASTLVPDGAQLAIVSDCSFVVQEVNSLASSSRFVAPMGWALAASRPWSAA
jgi:hypothetical protein